MSDEKDMLLIPCKRCGHTPLEMFGIGQCRYFCAHCCHEFEATVSAPWRATEAEAIAAWNEMQEGSGQDVSEKEAKSSSWAELVDLLIDRLSVKIKAVSTVSQSAKHRCGNSHVVAACDYLTSEAAVMQELLYDIKREIEKSSKTDCP